MRSRRWLGLAVALALGCGGPRAVPPPFELAPRAAIGDREARLEWLDLGGRRMPVVRAWIDDEPLSLLVDTGANAHFLEWSAASRLGLVPDDGAGSETMVRGSGGDHVATQLDDPPRVRLGLRDLEIGDPWIAIELAALADVGLAGVLSPQLVRAGAGASLELDLRGSTLRILDPRETARVLDPASGWTPLVVLGTSSAGAPMFALEVEIDGVRAELLVDTGSDIQDVASQSALGAHLASRPSMRGRTIGVGGTVDVARMTGVPIAIAGYRGEMTVRVSDEEIQDTRLSGAIGMEVLRHCSLVMTRERGAIRCRDGSRASGTFGDP